MDLRAVIIHRKAPARCSRCLPEIFTPDLAATKRIHEDGLGSSLSLWNNSSGKTSFATLRKPHLRIFKASDLPPFQAPAKLFRT